MIKNSKKALSVLLSLIMIMSMFTGLELTSFAENDILSYLTYEINDGEVTIADCDSSISGDIVIPDTIEGYPVTTIGEYAFSWCTNLVSISIGSNITSIDMSAFRECNRLKNIIINENNNSFSIDEYGVLFNKDKTILIRVITNINRTEYIIPDSVTSIGDWAFYDCTNLASISIPDNVTSIGNDAFASCDSLSSVTISNNATSIGNEAFIGCNSLESITIPDSVVSIGNHAFSECTSLTNLAIGNNVTSIGDCAFYACISLSGVTIPDSVTTIGNAAFLDCTGLKNVIIGDSVTTIGRNAFDGCNKLTKILIPDSVTTIEEKAFVGCTGISCIEIPTTIEDIGRYAFGYVETDEYDVYEIMENFEIKTLKNSEGSSYATWNDIPYYLFSEENGQISFSGYGNIASENITIPETFRNKPVTAIDDGVFYNNEDLTSITIPDTVTSIGKYAFYSCNNITEIDIPQGVTKINNSAFEKCESLVSVLLPDGLESIGNYAFNRCANLTKLTLPSGIKNIGNNAFLGCTGLTSLVIPEGVEYSEITYIEDQQIIDVTVSDNAFVKESVDLLPFDINSVDAVCEDGDYTLYITVERKDGLPLDWSGDFEDDDSVPYYETDFEDVVYALYATKDNKNFKKYTIEIEFSPEDYYDSDYFYECINYFSNFNIKYIKDKDVYYISSTACIAIQDNHRGISYTYGAFFNGSNITPLDHNYAKYHLLEVDNKYILIEDSFTHILDCELIESNNEQSTYIITDTFYYYVSDDLENWKLTQGPERIRTKTYEYYQKLPSKGIDLNQTIEVQDQFFENENIMIRFRSSYRSYIAFDNTYYADLYYSDNGIDFVGLEDYSNNYFMDAYFKYDDKLYCSINDCTNYNDSVWRFSSPCLIEYDKNGNIADVIYHDYDINFNYWYAYRTPGRFLQHGYSAYDDESNRYTRFYDILPDGTINSFLSNLDMSKMHSGISIGESELLVAGYDNNAFIIMDDFHKVYFVTTPFTFTHTYIKDNNLIFVGDEIYSISENEILKAIGREPIEYPPAEEPTTDEPTTEEPTTQEPTTQEPTTEESTTVEPTTEEPTTEEPTTEEPTTEEPTTEEPTTQEPTTQEPSTEKPAEDKLEVKNDSIKVDSENGSATISTGITADELKEMIENDDFVIVDKNGAEISKNALVGTGARIQLKNNDGFVTEYTVIVPTDIDGNGKTTAADARLALRASAKIDTIDGIYAIAADSNNDGKITAMDARTILRKAAGLE